METDSGPNGWLNDAVTREGSGGQQAWRNGVHRDGESRAFPPVSPPQANGNGSAAASPFAARLRSLAPRRWERLVGESPAALALEATLRRAARVESTVLITGETGCGKEEIARALHALGPRADGPFVAINCGAMAATLIESQLFGHEKGSFTGAVGPTRG
ncbi:MAG: sigma 54-interacting transcriptional regulator, partial [Planctomycetota bacterium]